MTKGSSALQTAVQSMARAAGVEQVLLDEWAVSLPELEARADTVPAAVAPKAWRWVAEMQEIASTFGHHGLPTGFHEGAAEIYRRLEEFKDTRPEPGPVLDRILEE